MTKVCPACGQLCEDTEPNLCYNCTVKSGEQLAKWHEEIDKIMKSIDNLKEETNKTKKSMEKIKGFDYIKEYEVMKIQNESYKHTSKILNEALDNMSKRYDERYEPMQKEIAEKDKKIKELEESLEYHRNRSDIVDNLFEQAEEIVESQKRLNEIYKDRKSKTNNKDDNKDDKDDKDAIEEL